MSLTSTLSSTLCIVFPTKPNSITGEILEINLASEVPPEVDFSGVVLIIFFILMQQGKGDASGMFGGGSSGAVFGASGAGNFVTKLTTFLVVLFFLNCLALAYLAKSKVSDSSVIILNDTSNNENSISNSSEKSELENNLGDDLVIPD